MTTDWVLSGDYDGFPLMYHWGGGSQVRRRMEELRDSSASIALFLEYIPQNVFQPA